MKNIDDKLVGWLWRSTYSNSHEYELCTHDDDIRMLIRKLVITEARGEAMRRTLDGSDSTQTPLESVLVRYNIDPATWRDDD